jgi:phage N-6-adenine-methyltransferase
MARMPVQKPGRSKQDYGTPREFISAVKNRLRIEEFSVDLAASAENTVVPGSYFDERFDSLRPEVTWNIRPGKWAWLNPPFNRIQPWVAKAAKEASNGAHIAVLVPASVGANWWQDWVETYAYQSFLNGRLTFVGETAPYPKDCALLLYTPWQFVGHEIWTWRASVPQLLESRPSESEGVPEMSEMSLETGL